MNYANIPEELRSLPQWVVHKVKRPYNPITGYSAKAGVPETWVAFQQAATATGYDGIGFEFLASNKLVGIDLDTVRNPVTGWVDPVAVEIIELLNSYTEISPSGYGFHIIVQGAPQLQWNKAPLPANQIQRPDIDPNTGKVRKDRNGDDRYKAPEIEMYTERRYFTMTGNVYEAHNRICVRDIAVDTLQKRFAKEPMTDPQQIPLDWNAEINEQPRTVTKKDYLAIGLAKDQAFRDLWDGKRPHQNESSDDQALMNKLAYWCNCNADAMMRAFKTSPHCMQKDTKHLQKVLQRKDYLERTAAQAIKDCRNTAENDDLNYQDQCRKTAVQDFADIAEPHTAVSMMDIFRPVADFNEEEARWLVDGWIPEGQISLLSSDGGVGKTTLCCELAAAISSGTSCILDKPGTVRIPQRVLFLTTEDSISKKIRKKLRQLGADLNNIIAPDPVLDTENILHNLKFGTPALAEIVRQYKPALCILDPVQGYVPADVNMGSRNAMRDCMAPLAALGEETGCAFLVVCHTNKRRGASGRERISDSSDLWDIARSVLMAGFTNEGETRYIANEKNNYAERQETILFEIANGLPRFIGFSQLRDLDYVTRSARPDILPEPENEALIDALKAYANPFEPVKVSYTDIEKQYGVSIWGGKQKTRAVDKVRPTLEAQGYSAIPNQQFKQDGKNTRGIVISMFDPLLKQEPLPCV